MHIKFRITFDDMTFLESHDANWNIVKDHCHALPPFNDKKWLRYDFISDDLGHMIGVDFNTGQFLLRGSVIINPGDQNTSGPLTDTASPQDFPVSAEWQLLNGLNFFPVVGRRVYKGDITDLMTPFCGWKKKLSDGTVIQKLGFVYPNGALVLT